MQFLKLGLILGFLLGYSSAEAQHQPDLLSIDSLAVTPLGESSLAKLSDPGFLTKMPIIDFPKEAVILVWWPDSDVDYKMPNALSPDESAINIIKLKAKEPKDENKSGDANQ